MAPDLIAPNRGWVGALEPPDALMRRHGEVAAATAAALGVPEAEILVEEVPAADGTTLVGWWRAALDVAGPCPT